MNRWIFSIAAAIAFTVPGALEAQGMGAGMGGGSASGEPVDRCAPEFQGQIPNSLAAVDTSGNGAVEKEELAPHVAGGQLDNLFGRWDKDGDGQLSEREFCFRQ